MPASADQDIDVSIGICTRNREGPVGVVLASVTRLQIPAGLRWEVVVVDNGSSDGTPAVIDSYKDRLPLRSFREETPGVANARNRAVAEVRGRYICWADDDVAVDEQWLAAYVAAFKAHPDTGLFGGVVTPRLEAPTPPWFARLADRWPISDILAARDFGDREVIFDFNTGMIPWGANHATRTVDQRRFPYDPELGVSPVQRRSGEETEMMFQMLESGAGGRWVPDSRVTHIYPARRQSLSYFYDHYFAIGETKGYLDHNYKKHHMNRLGQPVRPEAAWLLAARIAINALLYRAFWLLGMKLRALYHLRRQALDAGVRSYGRILKASAQAPREGP